MSICPFPLSTGLYRAYLANMDMSKSKIKKYYWCVNFIYCYYILLIYSILWMNNHFFI